MAASTDDLLTADKLRNQQLAALVQALLKTLPRTFGTFTLAASATTTVAQPAIVSASYVFIAPTNAAAATLVSGAKSPYWSPSDNIAGSSFKVKTADGNAAAGTETFAYFLLNPV